MTSPASANQNPSRSGYVSPPIRLGPDERIVSRAECWRPACRETFGAYKTVAHLSSGQIVAYCHRRRHDDLSYRADRWRHESAA